MRLNVYLPDELAATVRGRLPDLNVSAVLQDALRALLGCRHELIACAACATAIDKRRMIDDALSRFYMDLHWRLGELVNSDRGGTAEGAARIAKDVGERHQISAAGRLPLPRPSRALRQEQRVIDIDKERTA